MSQARSNAENTTHVLAIAGYGRSGSTILDRVLGHNPDVLSVGELVNVHGELWRSNHFCGCGRRGRDCPFWEGIREHWLAGRSEAAIASYVDMRKRWVGRAGLAGARGHDRRERQEFIEETARLYEAITSQSNAKVIVDSSKTPGWVEVLRRIHGPRLDIVHLVRDGRGVVASLKRPLKMDTASGVQHDIPSRSALHSSLAWLVGNVATEQAIRRHRMAHVRIAYESLLTDPTETLREIGDFAGTDFSSEAAMIEGAIPFPRTHAVAGGRVRMSDEVVVDQRVRAARISRMDALTYWFVAGILALRYGYRPGSGSAQRD